MDPNFQSATQTEQPIAPQPQVAPPPPPPPPIGHRNNMLLMILGAVVLLVGGLAAGYFLKGSSTTETTPAAKISTAPVATATPTPTADDTSTWLSYSNAKVKDLSLKQYTIKYPPTWTPGINHTDMTDSYTLTKGDYEIKIYQAPMGGSMCIFEGELPQGPATDLRTIKFTEVTTNEDVMLRRYVPATVTPTTTTTYNFCGTSDQTNWGTPTAFGAITYTVPTNVDEDTLTEMDAILKTLTEVK